MLLCDVFSKILEAISCLNVIDFIYWNFYFLGKHSRFLYAFLIVW